MRASYRIIVIAMTISCLLCCSLSAAGPGHEKSRTNVALGKKYTFNKTTQTTAFTPSQGSSTSTQLIDGKYGEIVGWYRQPVVSVTIDLGQIEPVSSLSMGDFRVMWSKGNCSAQVRAREKTDRSQIRPGLRF